MYDAATAKVVRTMRDAHASGVSALACVGDCLVGSADEDGVIKLWDLRQREAAASVSTASAGSRRCESVSLLHEVA